MLASSSFYSKQVLKNIQPYLRKNISSNSKLQNYPLILSQTTSANQIKFYKKYLVPKLHKQLFYSILQLLSNKSTNLSSSQQFPHIQPKLQQKIISTTIQKSTYLKLSNTNILSSNIISISNFKGIFIHRNLNMPSQCYSIQQQNQDNIIFRMRNKMSKQQHIRLLQYKKQLYNKDNYKLQKYYMDGYDNFIKKQNVMRYLIELNVQIIGNVFIDNKQIKLPINSQKNITKHLLQIQKIKVPGRDQIQTSMVTDIDYFMEGNPYTH